MTTPQETHFEYDVAISFAGEDRPFAQRLYEVLSSKGVRVFYDRNEQADLWGKDLGEHLPSVYLNRARYCLMLISAHYIQKDWTTLERKIAQARALQQRDEYILPVKLDDTPLPDFLGTVAYVDARTKTAEVIAELVLQKLSMTGQAQKYPVPASTSTQLFAIPVPEIRKRYSQLEKERFIEQAFGTIKKYFSQGLSQLEKSYSSCYPYLGTDLRELDSQKFVARVFADGQLQCQCKIWLGGSPPPEIYYLEGNFIDLREDNSFNDFMLVDDTTSSLAIRLSFMGIFDGQPAQNPASPDQAAEYLWKRFTSSLIW